MNTKLIDELFDGRKSGVDNYKRLDTDENKELSQSFINDFKEKTGKLTSKMNRS